MPFLPKKKNTFGVKFYCFKLHHNTQQGICFWSTNTQPTTTTTDTICNWIIMICNMHSKQETNPTWANGRMARAMATNLGKGANSGRRKGTSLQFLRPGPTAIFGFAEAKIANPGRRGATLTFMSWGPITRGNISLGESCGRTRAGGHCFASLAPTDQTEPDSGKTY
jgi:hypothetical protein